MITQEHGGKGSYFMFKHLSPTSGSSQPWDEKSDVILTTFQEANLIFLEINN